MTAILGAVQQQRRSAHIDVAAEVQALLMFVQFGVFVIHIVFIVPENLFARDHHGAHANKCASRLASNGG